MKMSKTQVVTLRVPSELKMRMEYEAKHQGVSMNNLANYFLTTQLSQIEALSKIEQRISQKNITELNSSVQKILSAVPKKKEIPEWDIVK